MRLKSVYISEYKNLKDFELSFNDNSFIDVFVGKNGTGKSNLFEALIEIFHHIYEYDKKTFIPSPSFDYSIRYEIKDKEIKIEWNRNINQLKINNRERKTIGKTKLPDNLLVYYSGHNETVKTLISQYEEIFRQRIKNADLNESRRFIGINSAYKELFLTILLIHQKSNKARKFILRKLGIESVGSELKITLKRPSYAVKKSNFDIENNDETDRYWKVTGITKDFLDRLTKCISTATGNIVRSEGFFAIDDIYIHYLNINEIQQEFSDFSIQELFRQFDNLKTLDMIQEISIPIKLTGGIDGNLSEFSDGQFQSVYIYSIIELFKDHNCITLLDEPDAFLHPEWQYEFLTQVFEITETAPKNNHLLMTSHSAMTLCNLNEQTLSLFKIDNNRVSCKQKTKKEVIQDLSNSFIQYTEDESKLLLNNISRTSNRPILFVEGITDVIILNTVYEKLYPDRDIPILIQDAFDRGLLKALLKSNRIYENYFHKFLFGLFDFDDGYTDWLKMKGKHENNSLANLKEGFRKEIEGFNGYALLLPVPDRLKKQVLHNYNEIHGIQNPCFSIEHIFYGISDEINNKYFKEEEIKGEKTGLMVWKGNSKKKVEFAQNVIPKFDVKHFEIFRPMFEFITSNI